MSDRELFKLKLAESVAIRLSAEIDSQHLTRASQGTAMQLFIPLLLLQLLLSLLLQVEALTYIELWIQPGFLALAEFLEARYLPNTRDSIAADSLTEGFYQVRNQ